MDSLPPVPLRKPKCSAFIYRLFLTPFGLQCQHCMACTFPNVFYLALKIIFIGSLLAVQQLRLQASIAGGAGLIPGQGTRILHATWCGQKTKKPRKGLLTHIQCISNLFYVTDKLKTWELKTVNIYTVGQRSGCHSWVISAQGLL